MGVTVIKRKPRPPQKPWLDRPDGEGLWWRFKYVNVNLCVVVNDEAYYFVTNGNSVGTGQRFEIDDEPSLWQRADRPKPPPAPERKP